MKNTLNAVYLVLLSIGAFVSPAVAGQRVLEEKIPAAEIRTIVLDGANGSANVTVGGDDAILIRVTVRPDKFSDKQPMEGVKKWFLSSAYEDIDTLLDAMRIETSSSRDKLELGLRPPKRTRDSRVREDWQITVPRHVAVKLAMARSDMRVAGVSGGVEISIGNGLAEVDVPGGDLDIEVTVGKARVSTGTTSVRNLDLRSQVGDTNLWMNGMKMKYPDPPGPGSRFSTSGDGEDSIDVVVQVGDAFLRVNDGPK